MSIGTVNNISFCATEKTAGKPEHRKETNRTQYIRTDVFKTVGALAGLTASGIGFFALKKTDHEAFKELSKKQMALGALALTAVGTLVGSVMDYVINKIVQNTTLSLRQRNQ